MTLYEILDIIADSYNPVLLLISIYVVIKTLSSSTSNGIIKLLHLVSLLSSVYIVQAIDRYFSLWASYKIDYSTHTAFSLAIVFFFTFSTIKQLSLISISYIVYLLLMLYQEYHTFTDIISTIAILSPIMYFLGYLTMTRLTVGQVTHKTDRHITKR